MGYKDQFTYAARKQNKGDWTIHAVIMDDGNVNFHTHGLEKMGLMNLEIIRPQNDEWKIWCAELIEELVKTQIKEGKPLKLDCTQYFDDANNYDNILHVFELHEITDQFGDKVAMIDYGDYAINQYNHRLYKFNEKSKKWVDGMMITKR